MCNVGFTTATIMYRRSMKRRENILPGRRCNKQIEKSSRVGQIGHSCYNSPIQDCTVLSLSSLAVTVTVVRVADLMGVLLICIRLSTHSTHTVHHHHIITSSSQQTSIINEHDMCVVAAPQETDDSISWKRENIDDLQMQQRIKENRHD